MQHSPSSISQRMEKAFANFIYKFPRHYSSEALGLLRRDQLAQLLFFINQADHGIFQFSPEQRIAIFIIVLWKGSFGSRTFEVFNSDFYHKFSHKEEVILILTNVLRRSLGIDDAKFARIIDNLNDLAT